MEHIINRFNYNLAIGFVNKYNKGNKKKQQDRLSEPHSEFPI